MTVTLEVCIDDLAGLAACVEGQADRIELCAALELGGLTPSAGMMRAAAACPVPAYALIRPRAGGFCFNSDEVGMMCDDIAAARSAGVAGVVLGAATPDGRLDRRALERLCAASQGMGRTLHRVVDTVPDPLAAVDAAIDLGFERILSSGGAQAAPDGADTLAAMQNRAAGRIEIMAGAGITAETAPALVAHTGIRSLHATCGCCIPAADVLVRLGFSNPTICRTDVETIRAIKAAVNAKAIANDKANAQHVAT